MRRRGGRGRLLKLVDRPDLKSGAFGRAGSSPAAATNLRKLLHFSRGEARFLVVDDPMTAGAEDRHLIDAGDAIGLKLLDRDFVVGFDAALAIGPLRRDRIKTARLDPPLNFHPAAFGPRRVCPVGRRRTMCGRPRSAVSEAAAATGATCRRKPMQQRVHADQAGGFIRRTGSTPPPVWRI